MLLLVGHLQAQGIIVRFDLVVLRIGDSLIRVISKEIADGDFLIAIVSPDSVESEWCQTELALAKAQGINEHRVKVLPVRFGGAQMPPMLQDTFWGDADKDDVETLACRLTAAMQAILEGRDADAAREAEEAKDVEGRPAHAEVAGDVGVVQIEAVTEKVLDVFAQLAQMWNGVRMRPNRRHLRDTQRRLRWTLDALPDRIRVGLPLVGQLANADGVEFFHVAVSDDVERDIREEIRSVRNQVAHGLTVTRRWTVVADLGKGNAGNRDAVLYLWQIGRGDETRNLQVFISGPAMASRNEELPRAVAQAKATNGRSVVASLLALDDPPQVMVTTAGISLTLPE